MNPSWNCHTALYANVLLWMLWTVSLGGRPCGVVCAVVTYKGFVGHLASRVRGTVNAVVVVFLVVVVVVVVAVPVPVAVVVVVVVVAVVQPFYTQILFPNSIHHHHTTETSAPAHPVIVVLLDHKKRRQTTQLGEKSNEKL